MTETNSQETTPEQRVKDLTIALSKQTRKNNALIEAIGFMANKNSGLRHKITSLRSYIAKLKKENDPQTTGNAVFVDSAEQVVAPNQDGQMVSVDIETTNDPWEYAKNVGNYVRKVSTERDFMDALKQISLTPIPKTADEVARDLVASWAPGYQPSSGAQINKDVFLREETAPQKAAEKPDRVDFYLRTFLVLCAVGAGTFALMKLFS